MTARTHWYCGHVATPENTKQGKRGMRCLICINATADRNRKIAADYISGITQSQLAEKYGLKVSYVGTLLHRLGVTLTEKERHSRYVIGRRRADCGRKPVWPNCPPHLLREYMSLRNNYGIPAAEARALLEKAA